MTSTEEQAEVTPADITAGIRTELATIRRHWRHTFDPPKQGGTVRSPDGPASRMPGSDVAISLRAEVTRDLAFWVHAFTADHPDAIGDWVTIDALDVPRTCRFLAEQADAIGRWDSGNRMWDEMLTLAREVRDVAAPRVRDTIALGECAECETVVRAKAHDPGNIKCHGCGTTDTIDGWIIRIVGNEPLVTAEQLVPILHKRMGIVVSQAGIRKWVARNVIPQDGTDSKGRARFDRKAVFQALTHRDAKRDGA